MAAPESARGQLWPVVWPLFSLGGVQGQSPGRSRAESSRSPGALESGRLRRTTQCLSGSPASAWGTQARGVTVWLGLRWNGGHPACRHSPYLLVRTCSTFDFSPTPLTPVRSSDWLLALTPNSNVRIVAGSERSDFTPFKAFTYQNGTRARDTQSNGDNYARIAVLLTWIATFSPSMPATNSRISRATPWLGLGLGLGLGIRGLGLGLGIRRWRL